MPRASSASNPRSPLCAFLEASSTSSRNRWGTGAILQEAASLAQQSGTQAIAVLAWEGAPRGSDDVTAAFGEEARKRGLRVEQVKTT